MDIKEIKENLKYEYYQNIDINYDKPKEIVDDKIIDDKIIIEKEPVTNKLSSDNLYIKPWTKLHITHKKIKIKEYINNLNDISIDRKNSIIENIIKLLINKTLKKNDIKYDEINGTIISIEIDLLNN